MGAELKGTIANKLDIQHQDGYSLSKGDTRIVSAVLHLLQKEQRQDPNPHFNAGRAIAGAMGQAISIDNYLHAHATDSVVVQMGKLGIASSILEAEARSLLAIKPDRREPFSFSGTVDTWYNVFFQMLTEGVQRDDLGGIFSNVSFITFNYDRCIEHYLVHALSNYYRLPDSEAEELVRMLCIEHPYGQVGRLPWQIPHGSVSFGKSFHAQELPVIAEQIRTFTERVENDAMLARMHRLLIEAEVVVYLGFSYGDMNMELLSLDERGVQRSVFGTSFGLSAPNKTAIERDIVNSMGPERAVVESLELADLKCADFLSAYWKPIMRG